VPSLLILDDDAARAGGFAAILPRLGPDWTQKTWSDPAAVASALDRCLAAAGFIALEASIAAAVASHLASRKPSCPVALHWKHSTHEAAWRLFSELRAKGWNVDLVIRPREPYAQWHEHVWLQAAQALLQWRADSRANAIHAANCERLGRQFEARESIYVEKYVRRVKVSHIRWHVDQRRIEAYAEEILTPGLGVPARLGLPRRWRFGGGAETRFSAESWTLSVQHVSWQLFFAASAIDKVVRLAATLPPHEVYDSLELQKLVALELGAKAAREERPAFP
jgi:hypothetical protein